MCETANKIHVFKCGYGEMLALHKTAWNSQEESVKTITRISKSENGLLSS